jgi:signal transduction histidine kinase
VIINLINNSIEAMRDANIANPSIKIETSFIDKGCIQTSIIDNGPGVNAESISRLFMPYFTTKPYAMGLGLAISKMIIESHGGKIWYAPRASGGSIFSFTLCANKSQLPNYPH